MNWIIAVILVLGGISQLAWMLKRRDRDVTADMSRIGE